MNSQSLQFALRCLDTAYVNFFRGNANFHDLSQGKRKTHSQFHSSQNLKVVDFLHQNSKKVLKLMFIVKLKVKLGKCTLSKTPTGKYFVSILSEEQYQPKEKTGAFCGIDLGLKDFAITSDGVQEFKKQ